MPYYDPDNPQQPDQGKRHRTPSWIQFNAQGELKHPIRTFIRLMFSDDNNVPSSARVVGTGIFFAVTVGLGAITWVLLRKIAVTQDAAVIDSCVSGIKAMLWSYCILTFSALSLYGIHVWKYVAQLQAGFLGGGGNSFPQSMGYGSGYNNMNKPYSASVVNNPASQLVAKVADASAKGQDTTPPPGPPAPVVKTPIAGVGSDD